MNSVKEDMVHNIKMVFRTSADALFKDLKKQLSEKFSEIREDFNSSLDCILDNLKGITKEDFLYEVDSGADCYIFDDDTNFIFILRDYLKKFLSKEMKEKNYWNEDSYMNLADDFLERIKEMDKHPEVKQFFINIFNSWEKEYKEINHE